MKKVIEYIQKHTLFFLLLLSLIPLVGYMKSGMPFVDDGQDHVARIANFFAALRDGVIVPRWATNLNWGYGHPVIMFLYPLSSYLGSLFHFLGLSFVDSTKMVFIVATMASVYAMYIWMKEAFNKEAAIIGSILYLFAPYRFVDLYIRGAIGEHVAFIFPPLIFYALVKLSKNKDIVLHGSLLSFSIALFILSHNAFSLMFLPIIALYTLYLFFVEAKRSPHFILNTLFFILFGFGLSSFFWLPALVEGKYTLRDIVTKGVALTRFVPFSMFLYSPWKYGGGGDATKFLGFSQWFGILGSIFLFWKSKENKLKWFIAGTIILLVCSLFIMTSWSRPIWEKLMILQNFQFPWRFQMISVFLTALLGGISIPYCIKVLTIQQKQKKYVFIAFCIISILVTVHMWKPRGYKIEQPSFYSGIYNGTTDTGESSPVWSVRFMEYAPSKRIDVIGGIATVIERSRTTTEHRYTINATIPSQLLENTLFFPGWNVYVDGKKTDIEFQDPNHRGIITFRVDEGIHEVRVVFQNTKIRTYSEYISLASFAICIMLMIRGCIWRKR